MKYKDKIYEILGIDEDTEISIAELKTTYIKYKDKLNDKLDEAEDNDDIEEIERLEDELEELDKIYMEFKNKTKSKNTSDTSDKINVEELFGKTKPNPHSSITRIRVRLNFEEVEKQPDKIVLGLKTDDGLQTHLKVDKEIIMEWPLITYEFQGKLYEADITCYSNS